VTSRLKATATALLCFFGASVYGAGITHQAQVWFCPFLERVHGNCISSLEDSVWQAVDLKVTCMIKFGPYLVKQKTDEVSVDGADPFTNETSLFGPAWDEGTYCTRNHNKFRGPIGTIPGQSPAAYCRGYTN
jgi:hypothetical protein